MALRIKQTNISEKELERIIVENPELIEEGFQIVANQLYTDSGPLDILAVDKNGYLCVIELKSEANEGHLDQGLRYYDWCVQNLAWILKAYSSKFNIVTKDRPCLMLVAPSFTDTVLRIAKYVGDNAYLYLYKYIAFEDECGEKGITCTVIDYGEIPESPIIPTREKIVKRVKDEKVKELFYAVLSELEQRGIEERPLKTYQFSFWCKGKRFMYLWPEPNCFGASILSTDSSWLPRQKISNRDEWDKLFNGPIKSYLNYLESSK